MADTGAEPSSFVDTNILLYARDASEAVKRRVAQDLLDRLWASGSGVVSTQVLQEFYAVATSRLRPPLRPAEARDVVERYATWRMVTTTPALIVAATHLHERHRISFWDALIVQAAVVAGAATLLTEDLDAGRMIEGVRVVNPFAAGEARQ